MIKAVLFDFNGTLLFDDPIHYQAWNETAIKLFGKEIDISAIFKVGGISRQSQIAEQYLKMNDLPTDQETIDLLTMTKCLSYNKMVIEKGMTELVKGAISFLDYLKDHQIPVVLVTMSIKENIDFYFDTYDLQEWFKKEETVYDDGTYHSKEKMYVDAAKRLGLELKDCLIVEDSTTPIRDAIANGCENIILIGRDSELTSSCIKERIKDFTEIDYSIFK